MRFPNEHPRVLGNAAPNTNPGLAEGSAKDVQNRINLKETHPPSSQHCRVNVEEESSWIHLWKGIIPTNSVLHCKPSPEPAAHPESSSKGWIFPLNSHRKAFLSRKGEWHKPSGSEKTSQPQIPAAAPPALPPSLTTAWKMQNRD